MAKIPEYQPIQAPFVSSQTPLPPVTVEPGFTAGKEMQKWGQWIQKMAMDYHEKMKKVRVTDQFSTAKVKMTDSFNKLLLEISSKPDFEKHLEIVEKARDPLYKMVTKGITEPEAQRAIDQAFAQSFVDLTNRVAIQQNQLIRKQAMVNLNSDVLTLVDSTDPHKREQLAERIQLAVEANLIYPHDAKEKLEEALHYMDVQDAVRHTRILHLDDALDWAGSAEARKIFPTVTVKEWAGIRSAKVSDWKLRNAIENERFRKANMEQMKDACMKVWNGKIDATTLLNKTFLDKYYADLTDEDLRILHNLIKVRDKGEPSATDRAFLANWFLMYANQGEYNEWDLKNELVRGLTEGLVSVTGEHDFGSLWDKTDARRKSIGEDLGEKIIEDADIPAEDKTDATILFRETMDSIDLSKDPDANEKVVNIARKIVDPPKRKKWASLLDIISKGKLGQSAKEFEAEQVAAWQELGVERTLEVSEEEEEMDRRYVKWSGSPAVAYARDDNMELVFYDGKLWWKYFSIGRRWKYLYIDEKGRKHWKKKEK